MRQVGEKTTVRREVLSTTCDICGAKTDGETWPKEESYAERVVVSKSTYHDFDSDLNEYAEFDCCPKCWEKKIVPLFRTGPSG